MRQILLALLAVCHCARVLANTEKTIFLAPSWQGLAATDLASLCLPTLSPAQPILRTQLPVSAVGEGVASSWFLLNQLNTGQRYEVRVCWVATQPTDFWLDALSVPDVFDAPEYLAELADHSPQLQKKEHHNLEALTTSQSALLLRVRSGANFYSSNYTSMQYPPRVGIDITLDPYLANILPRSLVPIAVLIIALAACAWVLSGMVWQTMRTVVNVRGSKVHSQ